jgi:hypothetical protein
MTTTRGTARVTGRVTARVAVVAVVAGLLTACDDDGGTPEPSRSPSVTEHEEQPMTEPTQPRDQSGEQHNEQPSDQTEPVGGTFVVAGANVMETPRTVVRRDLYVSDGVLVAERPDRGATVIAAEGAYAVPLLVDSAVAQRPESQRGTYDLVPGSLATFALVRRPVSESQVRRMLVVDPADLAAVYVAGHLEAREGAPTRPAGEDLADPAVRETWVGTWEDPSRELEQHLNADGRYAETRSGRANAYTGRYWVRDGRITYLDDSGFWAFGELLDGTLHHAGFVMTRQ